MKYRPFDNVKVSEVGLGCWQLGAEWGPVSEQDAEAIVRASLDAGVTFFDTADVYGLGRSETILGRVLASRSRKPFVATKLGRFPQPGWPANFTLATMREHTEASLRRLGVDVLDLAQLHCVPTEVMREGAVFDHLRTLRDEGKIRRFGASVESMDEALLCLKQDGLASLQIIFNIFRQKPATALFEQARRRKVALIVRLPLASGLLAGKFKRDTTFAADDHRTFNRDGQAFNVGETFAGLPFEKGVELAETIRPLTPAGMTMAQMAMRWILDHPEVTVVIPGATRVEQAKGNAICSDLPPLPADLHRQLRQIHDRQVASHIRGPY